MIVDRNFQLDNIVCVISHLFDGDDSPPCDFVRAVNGKFEAVVTRPINDDWQEQVLGQFEKCNEAVSAIWKHNHYEHILWRFNEHKHKDRPQ